MVAERNTSYENGKLELVGPITSRHTSTGGTKFNLSHSIASLKQVIILAAERLAIKLSGGLTTSYRRGRMPCILGVAWQDGSSHCFHSNLSLDTSIVPDPTMDWPRPRLSS